jgi:predicted ATPase
MLENISIRNFKSFKDVAVKLPRLAVILGPNAAGKSNFIDAIQALSRIASSRTLADALSEPIRGYPIEAFSFDESGLAGLLSKKKADFELEAKFGVQKEHFNYRVKVAISPETGALSLADEYLAALSSKGEVKGNPVVEKHESGEKYMIRRSGKPARPKEESTDINFSILSDLRYSGSLYRPIEKCRNEMSGWKTYYLDPRTAMREAKPPSDVKDIGLLGYDLGPFLYRLQAPDTKKHFDAIKRTMRSLIPSIENVSVELDKKRGVIDVGIRQEGIDFSARVVSEGTLRVLALCTLALNPWCGSLISFEEPENGVHPRRLELIADLLFNLALGRNIQVIVNTHSPIFCSAILRKKEECPNDIMLLRAKRQNGNTIIEPLDIPGPLFSDYEITKALSTANEDGLFESLLMRGLLDE